MKHLIRRLSKVADSSQYTLLRTDSQPLHPNPPRGFRSAIASVATSRSARRAGKRNSVPGGHVPVYVGEEMEKFVVSAELLNHPVFIGLLNESAQEYGYEQKGVLRIPCHVLVFERVMESVRLGLDFEDLLGPSSVKSNIN